MQSTDRRQGSMFPQEKREPEQIPLTDQLDDEELQELGFSGMIALLRFLNPPKEES